MVAQHEPEFTTRPTLRGTFGAVSSTHYLATASAQAVLERGGNAFDAAVAGGFVLHVVEPHLNGPGGDLVGIFSTAEAPGSPRVLAGQGPAPQGATIGHYRSEGLELVPGSGALAAAVPAAVDAWLLLLRDHGTWELPSVLEYAIGYAENGHPLVPQAAKTIDAMADTFREHWPSSAEQWLVNGHAPEPYSLVRNPEYAAVLRRLADTAANATNATNATAAAGEDGRVQGIEAARREWNSGFVAQTIVDFQATPHFHSDGAAHAGVLTLDDFADTGARYEEPQTLNFHGYTIAKSGPFGQGPVMLQTLKILEQFPSEHIDPATAYGVHTILEAMKLAFADRDAYYGDNATTPLDTLLSDDYATQRAALITESASEEFRPGTLPGTLTEHGPAFTPPLRTEYTAPENGSHGEPTVEKPTHNTSKPSGRTRGDTCHIDVTDRHGNIIAVTPSGGWLQSNPSIPNLGFPLGTRLQMTWLEPGGNSSLEPGKRPRTTLTPTIVLKGGHPVMALGSPGGDQQDQWQIVFLIRTLVFGMSPQAAIDAPTFHSTAVVSSFWPRTWEPRGAVVEDRLGDELINDLETRGHTVHRAGDWALGRLCVVGVDRDRREIFAAANPRGMQGYAIAR